jgi:hypothetical protein
MRMEGRVARANASSLNVIDNEISNEEAVSIAEISE